MLFAVVIGAEFLHEIPSEKLNKIIFEDLSQRVWTFGARNLSCNEKLL